MDESLESRKHSMDREHKIDLSDQKKKGKRQKTKNLDPRVLQLRRSIQECCRDNDLATAMEQYEQAIKDGISVEAQSFYNLLNLCDGFDDRPVHVGTPKVLVSAITTSTSDNAPEPNAPAESKTIRHVDQTTRQEYAFRIQRHMKERNLALNETAYTALIRLLCKAGRVDDANDLLRQAEETQQCKMRLRLYSTLLAAYCDQGNLYKALGLWVRLAKNDLVLTEKEYCAFLRCATLAGNASVFERVLSDLAEDVLVPSHATTQSIIDWFESEHATNSSLDEVQSDILEPQIMSLPPSDAPSMGPVKLSITSFARSWKIDSGCRVSDGQLVDGCLKGFELKPVPLSDKAWNEMMDNNERIVLEGELKDHTSEYQGGGKGPKRKIQDDKKRRGQWSAFKAFLQKQYGNDPTRRRLDVVIDGANVGYYKQNFQDAPRHVDYRQIDWIIRHFHQQGKSVLLVLHERHFSSKLMPQWAAPIVAKWKQILYKAPFGCNDDWFWLHAALWGGRDTLVLTNDEMRDHHFQMLSPRSFLRWKERQQIHFSFGTWSDQDTSESAKLQQRQVMLEYPCKYSRRIQRIQDGLVVPLPKRGDENRFLDGSHVADSDEPEEETYLCIRPI
jgi:pentatricopeptide repeat protein